MELSGKVPKKNQYQIFIIHSSTDGPVEWSHFLAAVSRAVMNMAMQVSLPWDIEAFGYTVRSGIAEPYDLGVLIKVT